MYLIAPLANKPATFLFKNSNLASIWQIGCKKCVESYPASAETSCRTATRAFRAWKIATSCKGWHHRKRSSRHAASHNFSYAFWHVKSIVTSESGIESGISRKFHPVASHLDTFHLTLAVCHASRREMPAKPCPSNRSLGPLDSCGGWSHQLTDGMTTTRCSNHGPSIPSRKRSHIPPREMDGKGKSST